MEIKEELLQVLADTVNRGLYQIIISNAREKDKAFKIKIRPVMLQGDILFQETVYQGVKVFHANYKDTEIIPRIEQYLFQDFKQCEIEHTNSKVIILVSKKGKMTIKKKLPAGNGQTEAGQDKLVMSQNTVMSHNRIKNYILKEGIPVPFLIDLGVQTADGR
ncbi:MAG: SAM-dependent methyltransferase, partial [Lachnospiraceae bacterium]|nr:SAM-dependent methyltransferase [Lachnospiraceae bacterium]